MIAARPEALERRFSVSVLTVQLNIELIVRTPLEVCTKVLRDRLVCLVNRQRLNWCLQVACLAEPVAKIVRHNARLNQTAIDRNEVLTDSDPAIRGFARAVTAWQAIRREWTDAEHTGVTKERPVGPGFCVGEEFQRVFTRVDFVLNAGRFERQLHVAVGRTPLTGKIVAVTFAIDFRITGLPTSRKRDGRTRRELVINRDHLAELETIHCRLQLRGRERPEQTELADLAVPAVAEDSAIAWAEFFAQVGVNTVCNNNTNKAVAIEWLKRPQVHSTRDAAFNHVSGLVLEHINSADQLWWDTGPLKRPATICRESVASVELRADILQTANNVA